MTASLTSVRPLDRHREPVAFQQVCTLGRKNSKTLGFFPKGAFEEHADQKNILIHTDERGDVDGYVAFRLTGMPRQVRIVHLCVREDRRGRGVAGRLLERLVRQTQDALGIGLYCRTEYEANQIWPKLEFKPRATKPGRGTDSAELVFWWRDNGHHNLFSPSYDVEYVDSSAIKAVLDANVVFDLDDARRPYHEESKALMADWLRPLVDFSVSPEVSLEIHHQADPEIQARSRKRAGAFTTVPVNTDQLKTVAGQMRTTLGWGSDPNTVADSKHLAYTALSGYRYFLTRDQNVLNAAHTLEDEYNVVVLRPMDFILRVDELQREDQYRPASLGDTKFRIRRLSEADSPLLYQTFRNHLNGEQKKDFHQRVALRLAKPNQHDNSVYETTSRTPLIMTSTAATAETFQLEFFRTVKHPLMPLLTRYALNRVVMGAFRQRKPVVVCTESQLTEQAALALTDMGFQRHPTFGRFKFSPRVVGTAAEVAQELRALPLGDAALREEAERQALSLETAAQENPLEWLPQVERTLWPAKVLHDGIGNFVVPIKPVWARKLFDEDAPGLFADHERLLLNWENVYYSLARRHGLLRPGSHILWYVSSQRGHRVSAIRACSTVEEVRVGTARELHREFRRLGVYRLKDLTDMAGDEARPMTAIRFVRTELLPHNISFDQFQQHRRAFGLKPNPLVSLLCISTDEFRSLYLQGHGG